MLAAIVAIAIVTSPGAGTVLAEPAAIEQPFQVAPTHGQMRAPGRAILAEIPSAGRDGYHPQPNASAHAARPVAKSDYAQEPESVSRGTEP
mgnify:CR=1 FL=1